MLFFDLKSNLTGTLPTSFRKGPGNHPCMRNTFFRGPHPPLLSTKTPKTYNELCLDGQKLKHELFRNSSKYTLRNTFSRGPPPSTIYKISKNIERTLFRWAKIKTRIFRNTFYRGPPPPLLSTKVKNSKNIERTLFRWTKIKTRTFSNFVKIHP